jgi:hypothetical protein
MFINHNHTTPCTPLSTIMPHAAPQLAVLLLLVFRDQLLTAALALARDTQQ